MSLEDYQKKIDSSLQNFKKPYWHPLSQFARIVEEVGEVSRILNHKFGDKPIKTTEKLGSLEDELADVIYSIICLANSQKIKLDIPLETAINKLMTRDKDRFERKAVSSP